MWTAPATLEGRAVPDPRTVFVETGDERVELGVRVGSRRLDAVRRAERERRRVVPAEGENGPRRDPEFGGKEGGGFRRFIHHHHLHHLSARRRLSRALADTANYQGSGGADSRESRWEALYGCPT